MSTYYKATRPDGRDFRAHVAVVVGSDVPDKSDQSEAME